MSIENYPAKLSSGYYRVRKKWEDAGSQAGAYRLLSSAMKKADENPGFHVYAEDGEAIYPEDTFSTDVLTSDKGQAVDLPDNTGSQDDEASQEDSRDEGTIAYARLKTLMNIRKGPSVESEAITTYRQGTVLEVLGFCEGGWMKIRCQESDTGAAYVGNENGAFAFIGDSLYRVGPEDSLVQIAEKTLGSSSLAAQIREANLLVSNQIRPGMDLIIP